MNISCIIPFMYRDERVFPLQRVLGNMQALGCEVIVIEQGLQPVLPDKGLLTNEKYLFLQNEFPFNKSWALNIAWKQTDKDIVVFVDADTLIDPQYIAASVEEFADYDFISPHTKVIDLLEPEGNLDFARIFAIDRLGRGDLDRQKVPICGGITMFKRAALEKIAGWPEEFFGWGGEDDAMSRKVKSFLRWKEMDFTCYHMFHLKFPPREDWYQRNLEMLDLYMDSEIEGLSAYIDQVRPLIGDKNRKFW